MLISKHLDEIIQKPDEVSTARVSGWVKDSNRQSRVFDPSAHADGTDFISARVCLSTTKLNPIIR